MYKEDFVDIMSDVIERSNIDHMRHKNMPEEEIKKSTGWNRPALDYAHELIVNELVVE